MGIGYERIKQNLTKSNYRKTGRCASEDQHKDEPTESDGLGCGPLLEEKQVREVKEVAAKLSSEVKADVFFKKGVVPK